MSIRGVFVRVFFLVLFLQACQIATETPVAALPTVESTAIATELPAPTAHPPVFGYNGSKECRPGVFVGSSEIEANFDNFSITPPNP